MHALLSFFVNLLCLPAVNHPQTENILSTYAWIFDLKLQYFLFIFIFLRKLLELHSGKAYHVTIQITASFTVLIPAETEALANYNVTVIKRFIISGSLHSLSSVCWSDQPDVSIYFIFSFAWVATSYQGQVVVRQAHKFNSVCLYIVNVLVPVHPSLGGAWQN
jgi:hypothetical protein